jgi:hypothetical protein
LFPDYVQRKYNYASQTVQEVEEKRHFQFFFIKMPKRCNHGRCGNLYDQEYGGYYSYNEYLTHKGTKPNVYNEPGDPAYVEPPKQSNLLSDPSTNSSERRFTLPYHQNKLVPPANVDIEEWRCENCESVSLTTQNLFNAKLIAVAKEMTSHMRAELNERQFSRFCVTLAAISPTLTSESKRLVRCTDCGFPGHNGSSHDQHAAWRRRLYQSVEI